MLPEPYSILEAKAPFLLRLVSVASLRFVEVSQNQRFPNVFRFQGKCCQLALIVHVSQNGVWIIVFSSETKQTSKTKLVDNYVYK